MCWCQSRSVCAGSHSCTGVHCGERDSERDSFSGTVETRRPWHDSQHATQRRHQSAAALHCLFNLISRTSECCFSRAHTLCLSVHEAIFCCLHQVLHCFGAPVGEPHWRPVCHKGSPSSSTSESSFLCFSFSFIIRIILSTMSCVFLWFAAALAVCSSLLVDWSSLLEAFSFESLLPRVRLSFDRELFQIRPAFLVSSHFLVNISITFTGGSCRTCMSSRFSPFQPCQGFFSVVAWCCSLGRFVQRRFEVSCLSLGLIPLLLDLVPDVCSRFPWSRRFRPDEDLSTG